MCGLMGRARRPFEVVLDGLVALWGMAWPWVRAVLAVPAEARFRQRARLEASYYAGLARLCEETGSGYGAVEYWRKSAYWDRVARSGRRNGDRGQQ